MKRFQEWISVILTRCAPTQVDIELMSTKELRNLIETQVRIPIAAMTRDELAFRQSFANQLAITISVQYR